MLKEELKKYQSSERPYLIENKKRETIHLPDILRNCMIIKMSYQELNSKRLAWDI